MREQPRLSTPTSRRALLGSLGAATVALAGCTDNSSDDSTDSDDGEQSDGDGSSEEMPIRGDPDAEVTLEVYEDFVCPHCQRYNQEAFPTVRAEYLEPGLVRYEHRDYPFLAEQSWQAVSAVREVFAVHGNDAFWTYKSALMATGERIQREAPDIFGAVADQEGFDGEAIQTAASERRHDDAAEADKERADELGIGGTPAFVVDGERRSGLDDALQKIDARV